MIKIADVIKIINPDAKFTLWSSERLDATDDDIDSCTIEWEEGTTPIPKADLKTKLASMLSDFNAQEYARNRELEYPSIGELTVALYDTDDKAAIETKRAAVKTKWPKDNSGPV